MNYNVDYHFHGNFPKSKKSAYKKASCLWQKMQKHGINVVISTEHAYKNYKHAYQILKETKPENIYLFPGIEYITKEGVDIVIFAKSDSIYNYKELQPYKMTFVETLDFIKNHSDLFSFVTHPYTPGTTSVVKKLGSEVYHQAVESLGAVEIANSAMDTTINLLRSLKIFPKKITSLEKVKILPKEDYPENIKFLAVGSDSHHCQDIGTYLSIESEENDVFSVITNHSSSQVHYRKANYWWQIISSAITTINEFLIKKIKF